MISFDFNVKTKRLQIKCTEDDINIFNTIRDHFSVANPNAFFIRRRRPGAPSRIYAITPAGTCEPGLYFEIQKFILDKNIIVETTISDSLKEWLNIGFKDTTVYQNFKHTLRDYQEEFLQKALKFGRGVCVVGTGGGKTLIIAALIENFYQRFFRRNTFKTLVIVPDLGLVDQTYKEFLNENVSYTVSPWTGKQDINLDTNVIVCNMSILQSRFNQKEYDWLKYVDLVIFDESHKNRKNNLIGKIVNNINTYHKYGFTGTLPEEPIDRWSIIGKLGPIIYQKSSYELRQQAFLANVNVICLNLKHSTKSYLNYEGELNYKFTCLWRNDIIKKICAKVSNNTLILVNRLIHGRTLFDHLNQNIPKKVFYIKGDVEVEDRNKVKELMESNDDVVCIAISKIFSTGINIKNIHNIIFADAGKAFVTIVQSIGRGLRLHENKSELKIFDLCDNLKYSQRHAEKRKLIYQKEIINVLIKEINQS
jgi:superfamily II DNA or RNA helicase